MTMALAQANFTPIAFGIFFVIAAVIFHYTEVGRAIRFIGSNKVCAGQTGLYEGKYLLWACLHYGNRRRPRLDNDNYPLGNHKRKHSHKPEHGCRSRHCSGRHVHFRRNQIFYLCRNSRRRYGYGAEQRSPHARCQPHDSADGSGSHISYFDIIGQKRPDRLPSPKI